MRAGRIWIRVLAAAAIGALVLTVASLAAYRFNPGIRIEFIAEDWRLDRFVTGFSPPERTPEGVAFAWSAAHATVTIPDLDRRVPWGLRFRMTGGATGPRTISLAVDHVVLRALDLPTTWTDVELPIDLRPDGRRGLRIDILCDRPFRPGGSEPRALGAVISDLRIVPSTSALGRPPASRWLPLAATGALAGAMLALAGFGTWAAAVGVIVLGLATSALFTVNGSWQGTFPTDVAPLTWALFGFGTLALVAARRRSDAWATRAWAVGTLAVVMKVLYLLHPAMTLGDTGFHLHRLHDVMGGRYFFTSDAPGGAFPYPIALYVIAGWFRIIVRDWMTFLRVGLVVLDALAAYALFATIRREWDRPLVAMLALVAYHLAPANFQVHAIGYQTNAFGQSMAVIGLTLLLRAKSPLSTAAAALAMTVAFLSHLSSFVITLTIAMITGIYLWRRRGVTMLAATTIATVLAMGLFYAHFPQVYRDIATRLTTPSAASTTPLVPVTIPIQRKEAHQTVYVPGWPALGNRLAAIPAYVAKYLTWPLVVLALVGGLQMTRAPEQADPLRVLIGAWVAACGAFFVLAQISPLDLRYYLAATPALCVAAAMAVGAGWESGGWRRAAALALSAWYAYACLAYWIAWFEPILPR